MSEEKPLTTTDKLHIELSKFKSLDEITPEVKKTLAKKYGCTYGLVQKVYNRLREAKPEGILPRAEVPTVKVEKEPEIELPPIEELPEEEEIEVEAEEKPAIIEKPKEEIPTELEPEEIETLKAIFKRSIKRLLDVPIKVLTKEIELSDQEAQDTSILTLLLLTKYAKIEAEEKMLEITSLTHAGSIVLKVIAEWRQKKQEEKRREEERLKAEKEKPPPPMPKPEEKPKEEPKTSEGRAPWLERPGGI